MNILELSHLTDEMVRVPSRERINGADVDPTGATVSIAFVTVGTAPVSGDYGSATWETDATVSPSRYFACRKASTLAAGDYGIWVQVATGTETVQREVGILRII